MVVVSFFGFLESYKPPSQIGEGGEQAKPAEWDSVGVSQQCPGIHATNEFDELLLGIMYASQLFAALLSSPKLGSIMHSRPENSLMKSDRSQQCHIIVAPSADIAAQADLERLDDDL